VQLALAEDVTPQEVLAQLVSSQAIVEQFEIAAPGLDEIFIQAVGGDPAAEEASTS
jgi:ABC-type uncharacterized transport system ATPase subunit